MDLYIFAWSLATSQKKLFCKKLQKSDEHFVGELGTNVRNVETFLKYIN